MRRDSFHTFARLQDEDDIEEEDDDFDEEEEEDDEEEEGDDEDTETWKVGRHGPR